MPSSGLATLDELERVGVRSEFGKLFALGKLRATVVKICSSPQRYKHFNSTSKAIHKDKLAPSGKSLCVLMVIREVKHHWNYTEVMMTWVVCHFGRYGINCSVQLTSYTPCMNRIHVVYGNSYTYTTQSEPYNLEYYWCMPASHYPEESWDSVSKILVSSQTVVHVVATCRHFGGVGLNAKPLESDSSWVLICYVEVGVKVEVEAGRRTHGGLEEEPAVDAEARV
ncbi:hypothetical protein K438DRAFT_2056746 [Mycena galopus ATCC 62051]|nr:hypothetical protein K438DRAFT_2056746 [Mycena galopus ATCC 62051]